MSKLAPVCLSVLSIAMFAAALAATEASAADSNPPAAPQATVSLQCHDKAVTGSGPGFSSSKEHSETAAKEAWLVKARVIFGDASWETAKEPGISCAKQGLYSKCFAMAFPCGSTPGTSEPASGAPEGK